VLVAQGRITEEQYLAAARAMVENGTKLTDALLEMGVLTSERLQQEQREHTRDQITSGFVLTQGSFVLEPAKTTPEETAKFEFRMGEVYVQGFRKHAAESEVHGAFAPLKDMYLRTRPEMAQFRAQLALDTQDEKVLKLLGEAYTAEEAVERGDGTPEKGIRLIAALKLLGFISEWKPGVAEFEARIRSERLRQAEEALAFKQKMRDREEQMLADVAGSLKRIEGLLRGQPMAGGATAPTVAAAGAATLPPVVAPSTQAAASPAARAVTAGGGIPAVTPAAKRPVVEEPPPTTAHSETASADSGAHAEEGPGHDAYREGMRQAAAGRLDEAETALREAVRLDAGRPVYLTALARVLLANPRYERSGTLPVVRSLLDRAQALSPGAAEVTALIQRIQQEMA
jgi:hypothetical protein